MASSTPRIVIVGAGPGGLASAMILKRRGYDVTLIERQSRVGGRTGSIKAEGFTFDIGPTFFLYPRILSRFSPIADTTCGARCRSSALSRCTASCTSRAAISMWSAAKMP
jgi:uncharacterized protein with NAD-binding domain and iron-sulfur cluster